MATHALYSISGTCALSGYDEPKLRLVHGGRAVHQPKVTGRQVPHPQHKPVLPLIMLMFAIAMGAVCWGLDALRIERVRTALDTSPTETHRVVSGDTMWSIAQQHNVEGVTTQELVRWLRTYNHLDTANLMPGQQLVVPVSST